MSLGMCWDAEESAGSRVSTSARGVSANLEEAVALSRFANPFSEAFRHARRA